MTISMTIAQKLFNSSNASRKICYCTLVYDSFEKKIVHCVSMQPH